VRGIAIAGIDFLDFCQRAKNWLKRSAITGGCPQIQTEFVLVVSRRDLGIPVRRKCVDQRRRISVAGIERKNPAVVSLNKEIAA
jgi:hypothetical protein